MPRRRRLSGMLGLGALAIGCATANADTPSDVPETLKAPAPQVLSGQVHAVGVQIYDCKPTKDDATKFEWAFRAPEADLSDLSGKVVGRHYAGPTWEAGDGSKVVGEVIARDKGPDAAAIPWLLLRTASATGHGIFGGSQSIQRIHTAGGKAPADGCDQAHNGRELRVPYSADYRFFK